MLQNKLHKSQLIRYLVGAILMFCVFNITIGQQLYNIDSVYRYYQADPRGLFLSAGRLWREIIDHQLGVGMLPAGITLFVTYNIYFQTSASICRIFEVRNEITRYATLGIVISFPLVSYYFLYGNDIIYYSAAILFAALAVESLTINKPVWAVGAIIIALFAYQMAITVVTALLIFKAFDELLKDRFEFKKLVIHLLIVCLAAFAYLFIWKMLLQMINIQTTDYMGASSIGISELFTDIGMKLKTTYLSFLRLITGNFKHLSGWLPTALVYQFEFLIILLVIPVKALVTKTKITTNQIFNLSVIMLLIPIFIFPCVFILGGTLSRSEFGVLIFIIYPVILLLEKLSTKGTYIGITFSALIIIYGIIFANAMFSVAKTHVVNDTQIVQKIENDLTQIPSYQSTSKVSFCGSYMLNPIHSFETSYPFIFEDMYLLSGPSMFFNVGTELEGYRLEAYINRYKAVFKENGYDINIVASNCSSNNNIYYPNQGYIEQINNDTYEIYLGPQDPESTYTSIV